jgi:hypothetical protein
MLNGAITIVIGVGLVIALRQAHDARSRLTDDPDDHA